MISSCICMGESWQFYQPSPLPLPPPPPPKKQNKTKQNKKKIDEFVEKDKKGYVSEADVEYLKNRRKNHNDLPFLAE